MNYSLFLNKSNVSYPNQIQTRQTKQSRYIKKRRRIDPNDEKNKRIYLRIQNGAGELSDRVKEKLRELAKTQLKRATLRKFAIFHFVDEAKCRNFINYERRKTKSRTEEELIDD